MPQTRHRRSVADRVLAVLRHVVAPRRSVAEDNLPDRIRRDIGLTDGGLTDGLARPKRRTGWQDWNM